jgi:glycerol-3-phosphate dehydrogenase (NAD(P)+)
MDKQSVCVLGGGSFGTALANIMAKNGHQVSQWMRNEEQVEEINLTGLNSRYLPNAPLHQELLATSNLEEAIRTSNTIFVSIPSKSFEQVVERIKPLLTPNQVLISTTKGFNPNRFELMSDILKRNGVTERIGVLSGPNLAKEIAAGHLTGSVIASDDDALRTTVIELLKSRTFRVYENRDSTGVELAGALKNIYAIVCGLAKAMSNRAFHGAVARITFLVKVQDLHLL